MCLIIFIILIVRLVHSSSGQSSGQNVTNATNFRVYSQVLSQLETPKTLFNQNNETILKNNQLNKSTHLNYFDKRRSNSNYKVSSSNYGIRVIKAPTLESLQLDGQRLKKLNSKLNEIKLKLPTNKSVNPIKSVNSVKNENSFIIKNQTKQQLTKSSISDKKQIVHKETKQIDANLRLNPSSNLKLALNNNLIKNKSYHQPNTEYSNYKYDHHIHHTNDLNKDQYFLDKHFGFKNQKKYHDLINHKIEQTKDSMKHSLIHHYRMKPNLDQINMKPLKIHLNPYLKDKHHRPNKLWGHPKFPPSKINQVAYNRKQAPDPILVKKQLEYRRNPYPHLKRFKYLAKPNKLSPKTKNQKLNEFDDAFSKDDFDQNFQKERKFSNFIFGHTNLDQLPSIDFKSLAPVYVRNIDYETFYKLNPYFSLPLPQYSSK